MFTIDSSTPNLRSNSNERPICSPTKLIFDRRKEVHMYIKTKRDYKKNRIKEKQITKNKVRQSI
jgi:hypothetical protein